MDDICPVGQIDFNSFIGHVFAKPSGDFICPVCSSQMDLVSGRPNEICNDKICPDCGYINKLLGDDIWLEERIR